MDHNKEKVQIKAKRQYGKIIGIIIAAVVIILAVIFLALHFTKPSAKDALTTASKTKISSARSTIVISNKSGQSKEMGTMNYEFDKNYTHLNSKFTPKSSGSAQNIWVAKNKIYNYEDKKWSYMENSGFAQTVFDQMFGAYKKLFTAHHFNRFSNKAFNALNVNVDGLGGYTISYKGNNKDVLEGIQKAATISGNNDKTDVSEIKNLDLTIKVNRKKQLRDMKYTVTYKDNKGQVDVHLYDINGVNNLQLPAAIKNAKRVKVPNIEN